MPKVIYYISDYHVFAVLWKEHAIYFASTALWYHIILVH